MGGRVFWNSSIWSGNTNLTAGQRAVYIALAQSARFRVVGYGFIVDLETALARNAGRMRRRLVPERAIRASLRCWEALRLEEGFDALWNVRAEEGGFHVSEAG